MIFSSTARFDASPYACPHPLRSLSPRSTAMQKYAGGVAEYRASEGKTVLVPFKGPVRGTVLDVLGGIRSACTYVGAAKLKDLTKRTTFIRCSQQTNDVFGTASK